VPDTQHHEYGIISMNITAIREFWCACERNQTSLTSYRLRREIYNEKANHVRLWITCEFRVGGGADGLNC
jgi:hypothetical protein